MTKGGFTYLKNYLQDIISGNKIRFGTAQQSLQNFIIIFGLLTPQKF
jgi:hypothetical protein